MSAFDECRIIEERGMALLMPFLREESFNGQIVKTAKGPLSKFLQNYLGDVIINVGDSNYVVTVEVKVEKIDPNGNLFIESFSNRSRRTPGWSHKLKCDFLFYYFIREDKLVIVHWPSMYAWLMQNVGGAPRARKFKERCQRQHSQMNDTWGRLVPISEIVQNVPSIVTTLKGLSKGVAGKFMLESRFKENSLSPIVT